MDRDSSDPVSTNKPADSVDSIIENSTSSVDGLDSETVVVIKSDEACDSCTGGNIDLIDSNAKKDDVGRTKDDKHKQKQTCVIDVKDSNGERICRICHLNSDQSNETGSSAKAKDLIPLGCSCKGELGIVHAHCAEAWFKLRGNRLCEICGEIAKNVKGIIDNSFMEDWNEMRSISGLHSTERRVGCLQGQPFCNFLLACLVIAFVLPWFFRANMF